MKKTLLLSVVASTMIMAGGDIAPVEPVVEAPVAASAWNFSGQAVAYIQTRDAFSSNQNGDLFGGDTTAGGLGLQLSATNADIFAGIGFGAEVTSIQDAVSANVARTGLGMQDGSALTQAYLTYGFDNINTSVKLGRQTLPKSLSPFAFTEGWQMFKNTFDAALVVNSSLPDTTLVYAFVNRSNSSVANGVSPLPGHAYQNNSDGYSSISDFDEINEDGVHMITVQNKSIDGVTLTGTWYNAPDMLVTEDVNILWADAKTKVAGLSVALQGGQIMGADDIGGNDTTAWGAKVGGTLGMFDLSAAYSSVDDGSVRVANLGTNVKTPLYTQSILDQDVIAKDADTYKLSAGVKALGGNFGLSYINADLGAAALPAVMYPGTGTGAGTYEEIDFTYKTTVGENTTVFAGYVYQNDDRAAATTTEQQDFVRFWARYNF